MLSQAKREDLKEIYQIVQDAKEAMKSDGLVQWQDGYPNMNTLEGDIDNDHLFVLKIQDEIVGLCVINDDYYSQYQGVPEKQDCLMIHRVAIAKNHLRKGYGKMIILSAIKEIRERNYPYAVIDTNSENLKMIKLIESCGFKYVSDFEYVRKAPLWKVYVSELN